MAGSIVKFFNAHVIPPRGGWSFPINGQLVERHTESDIHAEVKRWRQNNGTFVSDEEITRELWAYYCKNQPERCGLSAKQVASTAASEVTPRDLTKEVIGPWIWQFLNLAAVRWQPGTHGFFLDLCDQIIVLLDCPICRNEWGHILHSRSPGPIKTRVQACEWANWAHNQVNARIGKNTYPYSRMVAEYGAPMP